MSVIGDGYITCAEVALACLSFALAFTLPRRMGVLRAAAGCLRRLSAHPGQAMLLVAVLPLAIRFALLPWVPIPVPAVQEEFSNLLGADTLAHWRLANPPHPMSVFFDNVQIIQYPHYVSARLPGTFVFLFLGQILFHHPWFGLCITVALMCAAFYWMLLAWTRPFWALVCAILFALRFGIFTYWINSYWPASPAALGGALVLGATPRLYRRPGAGTAILYAAGAIVLVLNRPFEGILFIAPTAVAVLIAWLRHPGGISFRTKLAKVAAPAVATACLGLACLLYYNKATTGCPAVSAYDIWRAGQVRVPLFWWQPLRQAHLIYYSPQTWTFHNRWEVGLYENLRRSAHDALVYFIWRWASIPKNDLGILFLAFLLFPPVPLRGRSGRIRLACYFAALAAAMAAFVISFKADATAPIALLVLYIAALLLRFGPGAGTMRLPVILVALGLAAMLATAFSMPNYYPEYLAAVMILAAAGMRRLHAWRRNPGTGAALVRNLCLAFCAMTALDAAIPVLHDHISGEDPFYIHSYENRLEDRAAVARFLQAQPGPQLAIVRYGTSHPVLLEWVWNKADIDQQKVVWAREQKAVWTAKLLQYYSDRKAWLIEPDARPVRVTPYPGMILQASGGPPPAAVYADTPCHSTR